MAKSMADPHSIAAQRHRKLSLHTYLRRTRMYRSMSVTVLLWVGIGMSAHAADETPTKAVKISDSIYMAPAAGNVYMVMTPAGNVIIDTALAAQAPNARKLLAAETHGPSHYILLKQC